MYDEANSFAAAPAPAPQIDWGRPSSAQIWSLGGRPRNVSLASQQRSPAELALIEKGMFLAIEHLSSEVAARGDTLFVVECPPLTQAGGHQRCLALLARVFYNPKVFEVARLDFEVAEHEVVAPLPLPSR